MVAVFTGSAQLCFPRHHTRSVESCYVFLLLSLNHCWLPVGRSLPLCATPEWFRGLENLSKASEISSLKSPETLESNKSLKCIFFSFFGVSNPFSYLLWSLSGLFVQTQNEGDHQPQNAALPPIRNWASQHRARQSYSWHEPGLESRPTKTTRDIQVVERRLQIPWIHYWRDCITEQRASHLSLTESSSYGGELYSGGQSTAAMFILHPRSCYNYRLYPQAASGLERKCMLFVVTGVLALAASVRCETHPGALIPDEEVNKSLQKL